MPKTPIAPLGGPAIVPTTPSVGTTGSPDLGLTKSIPRPGEVSALPFGESALPQPFRKSATSVGVLFNTDVQHFVS
jgi:hypothetical protein